MNITIQTRTNNNRERKIVPFAVNFSVEFPLVKLKYLNLGERQIIAFIFELFKVSSFG